MSGLLHSRLTPGFGPRAIYWPDNADHERFASPLWANGDDGDSHLGDFIEDNSIHSPVDAAKGQGLQEATREVLAGLTAREAKVLRMRFGIDMNTDHTLEDAGKQFDVTRERIP